MGLMKMFNKSTNPMFKDENFAKAKVATLEEERRMGGPIQDESTSMTVTGAVNKTFMLAAICLISAYWSYLNPMGIFGLGASIAAAVVFMVTSFKPHIAPITAPIFAVLEGLLVGFVTVSYGGIFGGIAFQAFSLTIATLLSMLMIYKSGLIKVTPNFRAGVSMAVGAVMLAYVISIIGHFVGFQVPFIHDATPLGIGITVVIIGIAALNLLLDFDNFDRGEQSGAPKHMEWYFGMGLLFTLVWLYIEFLRLLSKLQSD